MGSSAQAAQAVVRAPEAGGYDRLRVCDLGRGRWSGVADRSGDFGLGLAVFSQP